MMPQAAIPYLIGASGIASMVDGNLQNKATIKNAENAQATAQAGVKQNQQAAFGNLNSFNQANPGLTGQSQAPAFASATSVPLIGQGQNQQQAPGGAPGGAPNPQLLALLQAMQQQKGVGSA